MDRERGKKERNKEKKSEDIKKKREKGGERKGWMLSFSVSGVFVSLSFLEIEYFDCCLLCADTPEMVICVYGKGMFEE